jgi:hypothetical protein
LTAGPFATPAFMKTVISDSPAERVNVAVIGIAGISSGDHSYREKTNLCTTQIKVRNEAFNEIDIINVF